MSKVGYMIIENFKRPDKALVEEFRGVAVANPNDRINRISVVHRGIRPVNKGKLLGPTLTVKVPSGDNLMFHAAMDLAKPGDMIVIDAGGNAHRSVFGRLMMAYCQKRGIAGVVVDGSLRDVDAMSQLTDFPIYARDITPGDLYKNGPGEINTPIVCGSRLISPGFITIGDEDGVIFINPSDAPELLEKVSKLRENEIRIISTIEGNGTYIHPWIDEKLEGLGTECINYAEY